MPPADDSPDAASYSGVQLFLRAEQRASPDFTPALAERRLSRLLPLVAMGKAERAAELFVLDAGMPLWHTLRAMERYRSQILAALSSALSPEMLAAAMERGRGLEMWETGRALLVELEALGWRGEAPAGAGLCSS